MLLAGLPNVEWDDLNLFRKRVSGREVAIARNEHPTDNEHGIVRRRNLCHPLRHGSVPAGAAHEVVAGFGSRGAFADVGKLVLFDGSVHCTL